MTPMVLFDSGAPGSQPARVDQRFHAVSEAVIDGFFARQPFTRRLPLRAVFYALWTPALEAKLGVDWLFYAIHLR